MRIYLLRINKNYNFYLSAVNKNTVSGGRLDRDSHFPKVGLLIVLRQNQCQFIPFDSLAVVCDMVIKMRFFIFPYQTVGVLKFVYGIDCRDAKCQLEVS